MERAEAYLAVETGLDYIMPSASSYLRPVSNMSQTIQTQMTSDDTKKEALDDIDVAEVNEGLDTDAERSSINVKKLIRKVWLSQGLHNVRTTSIAKMTGGLSTPSRTWSFVPVLLSRPNSSRQCKTIGIT